MGMCGFEAWSTTETDVRDRKSSRQHVRKPPTVLKYSKNVFQYLAVFEPKFPPYSNEGQIAGAGHRRRPTNWVPNENLC
jgi:hypothetical protein